jgi:DNA-binding PadR family transcriptional regulator
LSLRYALLALLLDGKATGYDLSKRFDMSVANFWYALPQQLYTELGAMERDGLVDGEVVVQTSRPNKRVFSLNERGRDALKAWFDVPVRPKPFKDELLVKIYAADLAEPGQVVAMLEQSIAVHHEKLAMFLRLQELILRGRSENEFFRTTRRAGPYMSLKRGIGDEEASIEWAQWAIDGLRQRAGSQSGPVAEQQGVGP